MEPNTILLLKKPTRKYLDKRGFVGPTFILPGDDGECLVIGHVKEQKEKEESTNDPE